MSYPHTVKPPFESVHLMSGSLPSQFIVVRVTTELISRDFVMTDSIGRDPEEYLAISYDSVATDKPTDLAFTLRLLNETRDEVVAFFRTKEFGNFTIERFNASSHKSIAAVVVYEKDGEQYQLRLNTNFIDRLTNPNGRKALYG